MLEIIIIFSSRKHLPRRGDQRESAEGRENYALSLKRRGREEKVFEKNMFEFIEKLRQKSDGSKKRIAFATSFSFVAVIFTVWLSVIYPDFYFTERQKQKASVGEAGVVESFWENMTNGFSDAKNHLSDFRKNISSMVISTSTYYVAPTNTSKTLQGTTTVEIVTDISTTTESQ